MPTRHKLSRREFLKMVGIAASAATLGACTPQTPTEIKTEAAPPATAAPPQPTATTPPPEPTSESGQAQIEAFIPKMILVEGGDFQMGSSDGLSDEQPVHTVRITRPFYIGQYEVTFEEYDRFYDDAPGAGIRRPDDEGWGRGERPVDVTWNDAIAYCNWLSEKEGLTPCYRGKRKATRCDFSANGYRLPTEAEWEYAARGGQKSQGYKYAGSNNPDDVAWYADNSDGQTHPVGQKQPNELGLYDMSGNLWEWCWDFYGMDYYASSPASDPEGPASPTDTSLERVKRGGRIELDTDSLRTTYRSAGSTSYWPGDGFRLARTA